MKDQCELFESIFSRAQDQKAVYGIQNKARNELKHVCDGNDVDLDLEQEAVDLIQRASITSNCYALGSILHSRHSTTRRQRGGVTEQTNSIKSA